MEYIAITKELEIVYRTCSKIEIDNYIKNNLYTFQVIYRENDKCSYSRLL